MKVKSLGYQTDLIFPRFEGEVSDCGDYLRIRTVTNPGYWWGNFLLFEKPPQAGDFQRWTELFRRDIGTPPQTEHMAFAWDIGEQKAFLEEFLHAGFKLEESLVMTAHSVHLPPKHHPTLVMRQLFSDADFAELLELECLLGLESGFEGDSYRLFIKRKIERYRNMIRAGLGAWFGAYLNEKLLAYLGLFWQGNVARYQNVGSHPDYRRQGIAGTLVHFVARYAFDSIGIKTLVMVADKHYFAKDLYASVGFSISEHLQALEFHPQHSQVNQSL